MVPKAWHLFDPYPEDFLLSFFGQDKSPRTMFRSGNPNKLALVGGFQVDSSFNPCDWWVIYAYTGQEHFNRSYIDVCLTVLCPVFFSFLPLLGSEEDTQTKDSRIQCLRDKWCPGRCCYPWVGDVSFVGLLGRKGSVGVCGPNHFKMENVCLLF